MVKTTKHRCPKLERPKHKRLMCKRSNHKRPMGKVPSTNFPDPNVPISSNVPNTNVPSPNVPSINVPCPTITKPKGSNHKCLKPKRPMSPVYHPQFLPCQYVVGSHSHTWVSSYKYPYVMMSLKLQSLINNPVLIGRYTFIICVLWDTIESYHNHRELMSTPFIIISEARIIIWYCHRLDCILW